MATTALRTTIFILNPNALRKALTEKSGIKLVDARPAAEFAKGHLPGAINLLWEDFCESPTCPVQPILHSPGYWGSLCTERLQALAQELADRGLSPEDRIIVVGNGKRDKGR
ncbi:MAG TPA: rhodanese-like domain-containing protein, partial [Candidatus Obscuribacter sp.]|nr:rhodanese-like domain-containing protein [Candidatus Obscuribacter sp.]